MKLSLSLGLLILLGTFTHLVSWGQTTQPTTQPATQPTPTTQVVTQATSRPTIIHAVWAQPKQLFPLWKSRGVNVVIGFEKGSGATQKEWEEAAAQNQLWFITTPDPDRITEQAKQAYRLGFMQFDEPDRNMWKESEPANSPNNRNLIPSGPYKGWRQPKALQDLYLLCKTAAPDMPVLLNFAGPTITGAAYTHGDGHDPYIVAADWLSGDWHYLNMDASRYSIQQVMDMLIRLARWSADPNSRINNGGSSTGVAALPGSKLRLGYVEASDQNLANANGRGPTSAEYEQQVRNVMDAKCSGWIDFTTRFGEGWDTNTGQGFDGARLIPGLPDKMYSLSAEFGTIAVITPPPSTAPSLEQRVSELERRLDLMVKAGATSRPSSN